MLVGPRQVVEQRIVHHVSHLVDSGHDPLAAQVLHRAVGRAEQQRGEMISNHAIDFFRHGAVVASQPGLDVGHGNPQLAGRQAPGQRGIRVTVHQHEIRPFLLYHRFEPLQHAGSLLSVRAGPNPQVICGRRHIQFLEKDGRHVVVIVLAGVDHHLLDLAIAAAACVKGRDRTGDHCGLDELWPRSDNRQESHHLACTSSALWIEPEQAASSRS